MVRHSRPVGAVAVVVAGALAITLGVTVPAIAKPSFPSWAQVARAKHSVAAKKAEIRKITALIASLQADSAAAGKAALIAGEAYQNAKAALDAATAKAAELSQQAAAAQKLATASADRAGQLAAQLARSGGSDLTTQLMLNGRNASNLLDALGTAGKLSESSAAIFAAAQADKNTAASLQAQAVVARKARAVQSAKASTALASAQSAASAAQARVTAQNTAQAVMTDQLASLSGRSKKTEAGYFAGVAWEKKQEAQKTPPPDPPSNPGPGPGSGSGPGPGSGGGGGGGSAPPPSEPNGTAVAGAIQFAEAQLGEPYVLDGMGPNVWDCSGLTKAAYASVGVYIGTHSSTDQYNTMRSENRLVPLSQRQAGDLLWYSNGGSTSAIKYHVTLYIGNGMMVEAPYPGAVVRIRPVRFGDLVPYAGRPTG